jgi:hypothetical protein
MQNVIGKLKLTITMEKQNSEELYKKLTAFDLDRSDKINVVKEILYKFSYCNLDEVFDNPDLLRRSVINYLYSGEFKLEDENKINATAEGCLKKIFNYLENEELNKKNDELTDKLTLVSKLSNRKKKTKLEAEIKILENYISGLKKSIDKIPFDKFYEKVHNNWTIINKKEGGGEKEVGIHKNLLNKFKQGENKIKYLLVYEAPPFDKDENYFLLSNGGSYGAPIKDCFDTPDTDKPIIDILFENNVGFFDLIMAGIPIAEAKISFEGNAKPIRYFWSTNAKWKIGDKQLPIILFELGIFNLIKEGLTFEDRPLIAIGTPVNTSASIFEFYSKQYLEVYKKETWSIEDNAIVTDCDFDNIIFNTPKTPGFKEILTVNLSLINTPSTFEIRGTKGETYPLFKANIIGSSNFPSGNLLKNAFNII